MTLKYPCCKHCALDAIHDVDANDHEIPCGVCGREYYASWPTHEVQRLTAEAESERQRREDVADEYQKAGTSWDTQRARLDATIAERDAMIERVRALCNEGHGYLSTGRVRAAVALTL